MSESGGVRAGELAIDSVTGVDVSLPVAGAGGRSFAFVIDWHIRFLLAIAWWLASSFVYFGGFTLFGDDGPDSGPYFISVVLPTFGIYFLYHPVLEITMHGRTPGKRMAGVRIVTREGATPGVGAILIRNVFRLIDSLPALYCLGLTVTLLSRQHVRIGDLAAGTLLVYDRAPKLETSAEAFAVTNTRIDARLAEVIDDLIARWEELSPQARTALGRKILHRVDPTAEAIEDEAGLLQRLRELLDGRKS